MATVFKTFLNDDVVTARTLLHEAIPISGSIVVTQASSCEPFSEGAYNDPSLAGSNVKLFPHGMFQSVYDYPYASSSANHIFDVTIGVHADDANYAAAVVAGDPWAAKKKNIYNQMAQVLVGHDTEGNILKFDQDGDFASGGTKYTSCYFINIARLLSKDEIRKGSFSLKLGIGDRVELVDSVTANTDRDNPATKYPDALNGEAQTWIEISDEGAATDYRVNSPAGEYGILKVVGMQYLITPGSPQVPTGVLTGTPLLALYDSGAGATPPASVMVGLIYYQAGIVVLDRTLFMGGNSAVANTGPIIYPIPAGAVGASGQPAGVLPVEALSSVDSSATEMDDPHMSKDDRCMRDYDAVGGSCVSAAAIAYDDGTSAFTPTDPGLSANTEDVAYTHFDQMLVNGSIDEACAALRGRIIDLSFNNTTELNSTIYFCRVNHNDFNYSSNPTYLGGDSNSKIRVKRSTLDAPVSYLTTIGLYSADNELLAVAKLSEPLRKDPTNEMTLRVRLDY